MIAPLDGHKRCYTMAVIQNAAEIGMIVGDTGFVPNEAVFGGSVNEWICEAAIEFDKLYPAGAFDDIGNYYDAIDAWTRVRMVTQRLEGA